LLTKLYIYSTSWSSLLFPVCKVNFMFYRLKLSFHKLLMTKQIFRVFLKQVFYQSPYHSYNLWSIMILQSTPFILYKELLSMMITIISPLCIESVTYQHAYYIHLLIVFILNAPFGDLYRLVMQFLVPVIIT
jgi:hypothetical protein